MFDLFETVTLARKQLIVVLSQDERSPELVAAAIEDLIDSMIALFAETQRERERP